MKVDYQSKKSAKSLQNIKNSLQKVCKKSAKRQKKSAKSAPNADFADSRRLFKKSARVCPPMLTQCFVLGFRGSHRAGNPVPLPGPPDPPGTAPDPHDERDFEVPNTCSLLDASCCNQWTMLTMCPTAS